MFMAAVPASRAALDTGHLRSINAVKVGGEVWVRIRIFLDNRAAVPGTPSLRVIMPGTRLAELIMRDALEEDHQRDLGLAMARARMYCWIPKAGQLARRVISSCPFCKNKNKILCGQETREFPVFKTRRSALFAA